MNEQYSIKKYTLTFKGKCDKEVSFSLIPNDINSETESENQNVVYIVFDRKSVVYVGEAKTSIKTRFLRGFATYRSYKKGIQPKDGYKGYKWIELFEKDIKELEIFVVLLKKFETEKENKYFRESVEGELCWLFRNHNEWPTYQNEIHFHNNLQARVLAIDLFNKEFEGKLI